MGLEGGWNRVGQELECTCLDGINVCDRVWYEASTPKMGLGKVWNGAEWI